MVITGDCRSPIGSSNLLGSVGEEMIIDVNHEMADTLFNIIGICFNEGQYPDTKEAKDLIVFLKKNFPDLDKKYNWLN